MQRNGHDEPMKILQRRELSCHTTTTLRWLPPSSSLFSIIESLVTFTTLCGQVYDYVLTIESEVKLVWYTKWNLTKLLFLVSRYSAFVDAILTTYDHFSPTISEETCHGISNAIPWVILGGVGVAEIILIIRTWAIWDRDRRIGSALFLSFIGIWATNAYCLAKFMSGSRVQMINTVAPSLDGCFLETTQDLLVVDWVLVVVFETAILGLTLVKFVHARVGLGPIARGTTPPLMQSLYRDGILFYVYLFGMSLINVVVLVTTSHDLSTLLACLQRAMHSILSVRLLLNLREASMGTVRFCDERGRASVERRSKQRPLRRRGRQPKPYHLQHRRRHVGGRR
ncbi:hypothetical protein PsYK624_169080 [Phanerochaete sordida]|uniref:DUF6533 domain-containing protein n=1 Tax=Phanerochaete sordida TaxID=48140 RepID=A0A9P3GSY4_9APHY|nr:hypothetical protein PsYK624_169080 [Phanerochaete sordida]